MGKGFLKLSLLGVVGLVVGACTDGSIGPIDSGDTGTVNLIGNVKVDPCVIDFGSLLPGQKASKTIAIQNTGTGSLTLLSATIESPFAIQAVPGKGIEAGVFYSVPVRFEPGPNDFGFFSSDLVIQTDDPDDPSVVCVVSGSVSDDADLDGFTSVDAGGGDCDDSDPNINPAAAEVWYDGVDQNCDGRSDFDQDGDGFETQVFYPNVDDINPITGLPGGDCQDVDVSMNPGQVEVWYDGKDADCDGRNDFDQDGDGYRTAEYGYNDCDDYDIDANPAAVEAFNGRDDDCNGRVDDKSSPERASAIAYGDDDEWTAGRSLAVADFDGNGRADIAVGIHLYEYGSTGASLGDGRGNVDIFWDGGIEDGDYLGGGASSDVWFDGENGDDELGFEMISVPDFDGDGRADLAVTAVGYSGYDGRVYLFSGAKLSSTTTIASADLTITGLNQYKLGGGMGAGDLDGDGLYELVMYGSHHSQNFTYLGVHYGSSTALGDIDWTGIDATFLSECGGDPRSTSYVRTCGPEYYTWTPTGGDPGAGDFFLNNGHAAADFDGDGYDDLVTGDEWSDDAGDTDSGSAWVLWGRRSAYTNSNSTFADTMTVIAEGGKTNGHMGAGVGFMPDVDGDGADELLVLDGDRSALYLLMGSSDLRTSYRDLEEESAAIFRGVSAFAGITNAGDWTGDGVDDIALGFGESGSKGGGLLMLESKEWRGDFRADSVAYGTIVGDDFNGAFGMGSPISSGDLDGNGTSDLVIGDFLYDNTDLTKEGAEGGVFVFMNTNL